MDILLVVCGVTGISIVVYLVGAFSLICVMFVAVRRVDGTISILTLFNNDKGIILWLCSSPSCFLVIFL